MTLDPVEIVVKQRFTATAERVFDAWLDPAAAGRWLFATPTGTMTCVEIDPRVGGAFRFVDRRDGEDVAHVGTYLELERPRRLTFTFRVEKYSEEADRVQVDIVPLNAGCELTLTHRMGGAWAEYAPRVTAGWGTILRNLGETVEPAGASSRQGVDSSPDEG